MPDTPVEGVHAESDELAFGPASGGTTGSAYVGTYKSREDAEKGIAEKDATISRLQSERDKARAENERVQRELLERLVKAEEGRTSGKADAVKQQQESEAEQIAALEAELADALENDPKKAAKLHLQIMSSYSRQAEESAATKIEGRIKEMAESLGTDVATLKSVLAERDPDWMAYKDRVSELAQDIGVEVTPENRDLLLKITKKTAKPRLPERPDLPGATGSTRMVATGDSPVLTEEQAAAIARATGSPLTKAELAQLNKRYGRS